MWFFNIVAWLLDFLTASNKLTHVLAVNREHASHKSSSIRKNSYIGCMPQALAGSVPTKAPPAKKAAPAKAPARKDRRGAVDDEDDFIFMGA